LVTFVTQNKDVRALYYLATLFEIKDMDPEPRRYASMVRRVIKKIYQENNKGKKLLDKDTFNIYAIGVFDGPGSPAEISIPAKFCPDSNSEDVSIAYDSFRYPLVTPQSDELYLETLIDQKNLIEIQKLILVSRLREFHPMGPFV